MEELFQPRVKGKPFRCECGSNVFRKGEPFGDFVVYVCNACDAEYADMP